FPVITMGGAQGPEAPEPEKLYSIQYVPAVSDRPVVLPATNWISLEVSPGLLSNCRYAVLVTTLDKMFVVRSPQIIEALPVLGSPSHTRRKSPVIEGGVEPVWYE